MAAEFRHAKAVVLATVTGMKQVPETPDGSFLDGTMYHVKVEQRFKDGNSPTLDIFNENSSGRFDMVAGESYLLFIYEDGGRLSVDNCGNSGIASKNTRIIEEVVKLARLKGP